MFVKGSYHQERIWFIDKFERGILYDGGPVYHNIPLILKVKGLLDVEHMKEALYKLTQRHEALRTKVIMQNEVVTQEIDDEVDPTLEVEDWSDSNKSIEDAIEYLKEVNYAAFKDGIGSILFKSRYIKINDKSSIILITLHHCICDDVSKNTLKNDFINIYEAIVNGREPEYEDIELQYADFSEWQNNMEDEVLESQVMYWRRKLNREIQQLVLPIDHERVAVHIYKPKEYNTTLKREVSEKVNKFSFEKGIDKKYLYLAVFKILMMKYSGLSEINIGTSMTDRPDEDLKSTVGPISTLVVLSDELNDATTFYDIINQVTKTYNEAKEHSIIPFDKLVVQINPKNDMSRTAFFDILFNYVVSDNNDKAAKFQEVELNLGWGKYDYNLLINESETETKMLMTYNNLYYEDNTVKQLMDSFELLADSLLDSPERPIYEAEYVPAKEKKLMIDEWANKNTKELTELCVHEIFTAQAKLNPDKIAVEDDRASITYKELEETSNQIANWLKEQSIEKDNIVGIVMDRNIHTIEIMFGILKAGGGYLTIEPDTPVERMQYILEDSKPRYLIVEDCYKERITSVENVTSLEEILLAKNNMSKEFVSQCTNDYLAYIIYTSGTTGKPKGVMVEHRNLARLITHSESLFDFTSDDVWSMFHSYSFDFSVWEIFASLLTAGKLVIVPRYIAKDTTKFREYLIEHKVTVLSQTPTAFHALVNDEVTDNNKRLKVRYIIFGGEALRVQNLRQWYARYNKTEFINMYGITETTIHVTFKRITGEEIQNNIDTIGKPLPSYQIYILDKYQKIVPIGVKGEIVVGGSGVARGYLNKPDITKQKFINNPFGEGVLYRSGDLAKWDVNGNLQYLGRMDEQVKIRGFRIELGEIENVIKQQEGVSNAAVIAREEFGEVFICAYLVSKNKMSMSSLRNILKKNLPEYMVPAYMMQIDSIPITKNGKIDKRALPQIEVSSETEYVEPKNEAETLVVNIYKEILGLSKVGVLDNFFEIGGHSLRATKVINRIEEITGIRLTLKDMFSNPTPEGLSELIQIHTNTYEPIPIAEKKNIYPMSSTQKRLFMIHNLDDVGTTYNMTYGVEVEGTICFEKIEHAFRELIKRHEILRTSFEIEDGEAIQKIADSVDFHIENDNREFVNETDKKNLLKEFVRPFDLSKAPLLRVKAIKVKNGNDLLFFDLHHIISDGMSTNILMEEFLKLYSNEQLDELRVQYRDYSEWMRTRDISNQKKYWVSEFSDRVPVLDLPLDYNRPRMQSFHGGSVEIILDVDTKDKIAKLCKATGTTEYMVWLSALMVLLGKYSRQEDIVVGSTISGRTHRDTENMLGMFVNTLAMRGTPKKDKRFQNFLVEMKEKCLKAQDNQEYPFEELVEQVQVARDLSRNPLFDVMFAFQNNEASELKIERTTFKEIIVEQNITKFDLSIQIAIDQDGYRMIFEFCTDIFKEASIKRMMQHFVEIIKDICDKPQILIGDIKVVKESEKARILNEFNCNIVKYDKNKTVVELFEEQVERHKDDIAVIFDEDALTYDQLNIKANQVAVKLRSMGIKPNEYIAIIIERSLEMIVALFGVIKAGAAYVPIDPTYPVGRREYILDDCKPKAILVNNTIVEKNIPIIDLSDTEIWNNKGENIEKVNSPDDVLYLIYTSGTTGKPKGVMAKHSGVVNLNGYFIKDFDIKCEDNILQFANYIFDASVWEIFMAVLNGATLYIASESLIANTKSFERYVSEKHISVLTLPPQYFAQINLKGPRLIITAGSEANRQLLNSIDVGCRFINAYGPTESTICATHWEYRKGDEIPSRIPIGKPISNVQVYILDEKELCGIGIPGELCIAGDGVTKGYLNRADLQAEKFVDNPFGEGKIYRSGDLARWLEDGNIEYLGRIDEQVKIRGYRIELGEIESVLRDQNDVLDVAVIVKNDNAGEKYMVAYVVPKENKVDIESIIMNLSMELPQYMIPTHIISIEELPVTKNGKLDKAALPDVVFENINEYVKPRTKNEVIVANIFKEILHLDRIGSTDNFFEMGGHSLRAMRVINRIEAECGVRLMPKDLFVNPTVEMIAKLIDANKVVDYEAIPKVAEKASYPMSSTQKRLFIFNEMDKEGTVYNIPVAIALSGKVDECKIENIFRDIIKRHEVLRTSFAMEEGETVQKIADEVEFTIEYEKAIGATLDEKKIIFNKFIRPFNLSKAPLMRVKVVKTKEEESLLLLDIHHIISDGMSINILKEEFNVLYNGGRLPNLSVQYKDYCEWMSKRDLSTQKEYWVNQFSGETPVLDLPFDYPRPQIQSFRGNTLYKNVTVELRDKIKELVKNTDTTEYMVLLSAFMILLGKYSRQEDVVVGSLVLGRMHKDTEKMMGMFVNTLVMRGKPEASKTYRQFLQEVKESCIKAYENQEYPFEELLEQIQVKRDLSRNPLFDVMFALQNNEQVDVVMDGVHNVEGIDGGDQVAKYDISVNVDQVNNGYMMRFEYCVDLFTIESVDAMAEHYLELLNEIVENQEKNLDEYDCIGVDEHKMLVEEFNLTEREYLANKTVVEVFEEQVENSSDNIAVAFEEKTITYSELNKRANQLARKLRNLNVKPDDFVAIIADRSIELIIAIFGVIKSGAAYVVIQQDYPEERIKFILEDCNPKVLLHDANSKIIDYHIERIDLSDRAVYSGDASNLESVNKISDLLYLIYTSGTTGKPKGVMVEHKGIVNLQNYFITEFGLSKEDRVLQFSNTVFDASVWEITMALLTGARLVMVSKDTISDVDKFEKELKNQGVTVATLPPQYCVQIKNLTLKLLVTAGSESNQKVIEKAVGTTRYINAYGPTETTICATYWECKKKNEAYYKIPIGIPVPNTKVYVLNHNSLCGIGMPGELCVTGVSLARGYLNCPDLNNEKFVPNPFGKGNMYRTGDLVRWLSDGNIEYLGRIDEQVKIRGFRIELGEIESVIRNQENIVDATVIVKEFNTNDKQLVSYFVSSDDRVDIVKLRKNIEKMLPDYMVPSYFISLEKIPVTVNGKIDKKALSNIEIKSNKEYIAPRNAEEKRLAKIFADVLSIEKISVIDNFFELGGDSIKAMRIVSKLREEGYNLDIKAIMQGRTVEIIASYITVSSDVNIYEQDEVTGNVELIPIQHQFYEWNLAKKEHFNQAVTLKSKEPIDVDGLRKVFEVIVRHHDVLRSTFKNGKQTIQSMQQSKGYELNVYELYHYAGNELYHEIETICNEIQASFNLEEGPLFKTAVFKTDYCDHILIVAHHLVVDGMSLRILIEDILKAYGQIKAGKEIILPKKTASFKLWSESLHEYANSSKLQDELLYWQRICSMTKTSAVGSKALSNDRKFSNKILELTKETTRSLLYEVNKAYNTEINDILLAGLSIAVKETFGNYSVAVQLEGHGREILNKEIHVDRTVGWFTSTYPVLLEVDDNLEKHIIKTKELLRKVPNHGLGYGVLKYLGKNDIDVSTDISFNYMGDFGVTSDSETIMTRSEVIGGKQCDSANMFGTDIAINGNVINGVFSFVITYNENKYYLEDIDKLLSNYKYAIQKIVDKCISNDEATVTASDLGDASDLSDDEWNAMLSAFTRE